MFHHFIKLTTEDEINIYRKVYAESTVYFSDELIKAKERQSLLKSYETSELSKEQQITQKIVLFDLGNQIEQGELFPFHSYPINQIGGLHLNLIEFMTDIHPIRNTSEAEYYIDRLNLFDEVFKATLEILQEQRNNNIFPPEFVFHHVIRQLNEFLNFSYEENPLFTVFVRKIEELNISNEIKNDLREKVKIALEQSVNPGFKNLLLFMEGTLPEANKHDGVWSLPNGDDFYSLRLKVYTTTDFSAADIHTIGLKEVERISTRMRNILDELGYDKEGIVGDLMNQMNEDPQFLRGLDDRAFFRNTYFTAVDAQAGHGATSCFAAERPLRMYSSNSSRNLLIKLCTGIAAASESTHIVVPSIPEATLSSRARSSGPPSPSSIRARIFSNQPVPSRQGEHCPQDS